MLMELVELQPSPFFFKMITKDLEKFDRCYVLAEVLSDITLVFSIRLKAESSIAM